MTGILEQFSDPVGESYRLPNMSGPITRRLRLLGGDPAGSHIRDIGDVRSVELHSMKNGGEGLEHSVHHGRMKRMRRVQVPDFDAFRLEVPLQRRDGLVRT